MKQSQSIVRHPLLTANLANAVLTNHVEIKRIDFAGGQQAGLHFHPCPVVGYVAKGSILFQMDGQPPKTLHAGDAFFEPANVKMLHFDNASATEPATFITFYLLEENQHELITML